MSWARPLLGFIAGDLNASPSIAGWLITVTQIGYAGGITASSGGRPVRWETNVR
jgi:hypothetical protein